MISPFHSIISYEGDEWQEFLDKMLLIDIFMPLFKEYSEVSYIKSVIKYIVYAYSVDSDKIILGMEWQKNKQNIFEYVMIKPEKKSYEDLVLLRNSEVVKTINNWLEFQDNDAFRQMQVLKDLRVEMQISSLTDIKKASAEIDYDQKYKNACYANDLKKMIKDLESELIQNNQRLKDAVKEVRVTKSKFTVGPETFSK